jgi:hypothetical protein
MAVKSHIFSLLFISTFALWLTGCSSVAKSEKISQPLATNDRNPANEFDEYLHTEIPPGDGFDFPFGSSADDNNPPQGWSVVSRFAERQALGINPGEDWKFIGDQAAALEQRISSVANGRVILAQKNVEHLGNVIIIEHLFYENYEKRKICSVYAHLSRINVQVGEAVKKHQPIATLKQDSEADNRLKVHIELKWTEALEPTSLPSVADKDQTWVKRHYAAPSQFISQHRKLFVPQQEAKLLVVSHQTYKMRLYETGKMFGEYDVSFGQSKGQKQAEGDNKTPKGMYFVIQKHRGKFDGTYGGYYGGHWIKINYPNKYDAALGRETGKVTPQQAEKIAANWQMRAPTAENTGLGGGIGFHGWIKEWRNDGPRHLSWGCVVMHIYDISRLYDALPQGTMVVIF